MNEIEKMKHTLQQDMLKTVYKLLSHKKFYEHLIKELVEDIDIPFINEKQEYKVLKAIYRAVLNSIQKTIEK